MLAILGGRAICRTTAARSHLHGPVFQTHDEQEAVPWEWVARMISEREYVVCRAHET
jgi:hypothetical protein